MNRPSPLYAIVLMCTAAACFVVSNALVKHIGQWLPTGELLFIRGCFAALILLTVALASQGTRQLHMIVRRPVLARATVEGIGSTLFLASLAWLPLANATAIDLSAPLMLTALAVVFLGERVPPQRWLAVIAGFVGVLLVAQPRAHDFNAATLLCILGTGLHAVRDLLTRRIPADVPSVLVVLSSTIALTVLAGAWTLVEGWQPVDWLHLGWLALGAGFLVGGVLCAVASLRRGALSTVAPFRCLSLPFALVLGFVAWGELPGPLAWAGASLIAASSLCVLHGAKSAHGSLRPVPLLCSTLFDTSCSQLHVIGVGSAAELRLETAAVNSDTRRSAPPRKDTSARCTGRRRRRGACGRRALATTGPWSSWRKATQPMSAANVVKSRRWRGSPRT